MSLFELSGLFTVMFALAALPSASVALVVVHTSTAGWRSGLAVAAGIVAVDLVFALLAIAGLGALAGLLGSLFAFVRYLAAAYLLWLGIGLIRRARPDAPVTDLPVARSPFGAFLAGALLTLGDVKAILFYASLFPAFVDVGGLAAADVLLVLLTTTLAVGGTKVLYVLSAGRIAQATSRSTLRRPLQTASGVVMVGAGGYLLVKT